MVGVGGSNPLAPTIFPFWINGLNVTPNIRTIPVGYRWEFSGKYLSYTQLVRHHCLQKTASI